jgi:competence protein ComEC
MRLVYITLGWAAGILLAANNPNGTPALAWLILAAVTLVAIGLLRDEPAQRMLAVAVLAFTLGGLRFALVPRTSQVAQYVNQGGLTIEGVVSAEPDVRDDRVLLRVDASTITRNGQTAETSGTVLVTAPRTTAARYGDQIAATDELTVPGQSNTFSYGDYLARSGVFATMQNAAVEVLSSGHGSPIYAALLDFKTRTYDIITRALPEPNASLLAGVLLGNTSGIAPEVDDAFSRVGASHVIAISGFNMAILSGVVAGMLARFGVRGWRAAVIGIGVLLVYTLLVGANASVVRAAIMSSMLLIGGLLRRRTYVPASLAFVALLMSLLNPTVLWDISFQLSLFATLGLSLFADPFARRMDWLLARAFPKRLAAPIGDFLAEPFTVTLAAQVTTLPLIVLYFGRLSLVSLLVNLLIIPVQAQLLVLGLVATLAALVVPTLAQLLFWLDMLLLAWTIGVVRLFANLPFADTEFHIDPRLITLFFMLLIGGAMMQATQPAWAVRLATMLRRRAVFTATAFAGVGIAVLGAAIILSRPDGNLHVWLLDMGQGNAVLVQTPGGAHLLVDGGRFPSRLLTALGDRLPFNKQTIDVLAITQPDEFNTSALFSVLDRYDVGLVLTNGQDNLSPAYQTIEQRLSGKPLAVVRAGYTVDLDDGTHLEILNPAQQPDLGDSLDNNALVLRLTYGEVSFLLTGDLGRDGQNTLLKNGSWPLATVMQLPAHGAIRTLDDDFLKAVQPQAVMVASDPGSRQGALDDTTLSQLGTVPVFRTDQGGTIHLWTDGENLWKLQEP